MAPVFAPALRKARVMDDLLRDVERDNLPARGLTDKMVSLVGQNHVKLRRAA